MASVAIVLGSVTCRVSEQVVRWIEDQLVRRGRAGHVLDLRDYRHPARGGDAPVAPSCPPRANLETNDAVLPVTNH